MCCVFNYLSNANTEFHVWYLLNLFKLYPFLFFYFVLIFKVCFRKEDGQFWTCLSRFHQHTPPCCFVSSSPTPPYFLDPFPHFFQFIADQHRVWQFIALYYNLFGFEIFCYSTLQIWWVNSIIFYSCDYEKFKLIMWLSLLSPVLLITSSLNPRCLPCLEPRKLARRWLCHTSGSWRMSRKNRWQLHRKWFRLEAKKCSVLGWRTTPNISFSFSWKLIS